MSIASLQRNLSVVRNNDEAIARWVSYVISPHIVGVIITAVLSLQYGGEPLEIFLWLALLIPFIVGPPLIYLFWLVRKGLVEDIYLPRRETRVRPLIVSMVWLTVCLGMIRYWQAPQIVETIMWVSLGLMAILSGVTLFWKISFHGATISAAAMVTMMIAGSHTWPVMLLVLLVGWSRIRLQRHTPRQVIYGSLLGAMIASVTVYGILLRIP